MLVLGDESYSYIRESASDSCAEDYHHTHYRALNKKTTVYFCTIKSSVLKNMKQEWKSLEYNGWCCIPVKKMYTSRKDSVTSILWRHQTYLALFIFHITSMSKDYIFHEMIVILLKIRQQTSWSLHRFQLKKGLKEGEREDTFLTKFNCSIFSIQRILTLKRSNNRVHRHHSSTLPPHTSLQYCPFLPFSRFRYWHS